MESDTINIDVVALSGEALQSLCVAQDILGQELLELLLLDHASHRGHVAKLLIHGQFPLDNFAPLNAQDVTKGSRLMLIWKPVSDCDRMRALVKKGLCHLMRRT